MKRASGLVIFALLLHVTSGALAHSGSHNGTSTSLDEYLDQRDQVTVCKTHDRNGSHQKNKTLSIKTERKKAIKDILSRGGYLGPCAEFGDKRSMGAGYFETYVQLKKDGTPWAIGYSFPERTLTQMPTTKNDGQNCFDVNDNGILEEDGSVILIGDPPHHSDECVGGHSSILDFPHQDKIKPFKWALVNYQINGHNPSGVYDKPHFDFHFMTMDFATRNYIRVGPCGMLINCDDYQTALQPVPAKFVHPDFISVGAAEARMGNHLVDTMASEWHGHEYTETWMYGAYAGKIVYWEPMISLAYLQSHPYTCRDLKLPEAYQEAGHYPTQYCMRYLPSRKEYRVSLEGMVFREKSQ